MYDCLKDSLVETGYQILDVHNLTLGSSLSDGVSDLMSKADAVVALLTDQSVKSQSVMNEVAVAKAHAAAAENKLFIPLVVGMESEIPNFLRDSLLEMVPNVLDENLKRITLNIQRAIEHNKALFIEKQKVAKSKAEKLEVSKTEFIKEAELRLTQKEVTLKRNANFWYCLGYFSLLTGVIAAFLLISETLGKDSNLNILLLLSMKGLVGVGLLIASSKYAFTLGKSYMSESLKNSDRLHAISFGKFYLQAYGSDATAQDVKEVFQHWNMDNDSAFSSASASNFDPKLLESAIELAKIISKNEKQKPKNT